MINKIYISTSDASLIQSAQTTAISSLGYLWAMGPVEEMRTIKVISPSKWSWMVIDSSGIYTTNKGPDKSNKSVMEATSISDITTAFASSTAAPTYSQPSLSMTFTGDIFDITDTGYTASFTSSIAYNRKGNITGMWSFGDNTTSSYVSTITHSYDGMLTVYTADLSITESMYNLKSSASASVDPSFNKIILI